ncbi:hypothetical protein ACTXT7_001013 [Hymenolepis weldensis]
MDIRTHLKFEVKYEKDELAIPRASPHQKVKKAVESHLALSTCILSHSLRNLILATVTADKSVPHYLMKSKYVIRVQYISVRTNVYWDRLGMGNREK